MTKKYKILEGDHYITNVCNLTCDNCITYNDFKFKGHYKFEDYRVHYEEWSKILDIEMMNILGGEPYANPDLWNWAYNLKKLWPEVRDTSLVTNGTYFNTHKELTRDIIDLGWWLDISVHDPSHYEEVKYHVEEMLSKYQYTTTEITKTTLGRKFEDPGKQYYIDGKLVADIRERWKLHTSSRKEIRDGVMYLHDSDTVIAHENCSANKCHYFVKGHLYKCHLVAFKDDFINQFNIEQRAVDLLQQYQACGPWDSEESIKNFTDKLLDVIPQCNLCPESRIEQIVWPLSKLKKSIV